MKNIIKLICVAYICFSYSAFGFNPNVGVSDSNPLPVGLNAGSGVSASVSIQGIDQTSIPRIVLTTSSGVTYINSESVLSTYHASSPDIVPVASATDILNLCGSANKIVRINRVEITADASAASVIDFYIFKRTAANTGGTVSSVAISQSDTLDPAPTATVNKYTSNPAALGTGILIVADHYALPAAATTGYPSFPWVEDFGTRNDKTIVLRGVNECIAINLNGQTIPSGLNVYGSFVFTESNN